LLDADSCVDPTFTEAPFDTDDTVFDTCGATFFGKLMVSSAKEAHNTDSTSIQNKQNQYKTFYYVNSKPSL